MCGRPLLARPESGAYALAHIALGRTQSRAMSYNRAEWLCAWEGGEATAVCGLYHSLQYCCCE